MTEFHDELSDQLMQAWPSGVPEGETTLANRLSREMRTLVARRLYVVRRFLEEAVDQRAPSGGLTDLLQIGSKRFYAMAHEFRVSRSIAALGARAAEKRTRPARIDVAVRAKAMEVVRTALADDAGATVASIVRRLAAVDMPRLSYSMVRRLWLEARRSSPPGAIGAELLFDSVGLDAMSNWERMRLYLLFDRGSGLILGTAEGTNQSMYWGDIHAAVDALENLEHLDLTGLSAASGRPKVSLSLQSNSGKAGQIVSRRLKDAGITCEADCTAVGRAAIQALGERLGSVWIGVGERDDEISYRNGRKARMPEYTSELSKGIRQAVREHNLQRINAAQPGGSPDEALDDARRSISQVLDVIADSAVELRALPLRGMPSREPIAAASEGRSPWVLDSDGLDQDGRTL